ncbi:hypothetical protein S40293_09225, partial [Stachybotrys chartarum IBT 40293]
EDLRANSHAAWGVFCWGVFLTYFSGQPDASNPDFAPNLPIPQCPSVLRSHGRMSESGFSGQQDLMGSTFPALCEFWLLIHNGIGMHYEGRFDAPPETWTSKLAEHKFREVISWMNSLSPSLIRAKKSGDHFPIFDILLHAAPANIVRPFASDSLQDEQSWKTFTATDSSAGAAYKASVNQLKSLIRDYHENYQCERKIRLLGKRQTQPRKDRLRGKRESKRAPATTPQSMPAARPIKGGNRWK